jgi:anti-sigma B factor antagonist
VNEYLLDSPGSMADMMPGFTVREDCGHTIIKAVGEIDAYSAPALTATIRKQILDGHYRLIVDLSGVPFLDSSGLGALVGGYKRTKAHPDGRFAVVGACKRFIEVLRITGLVRVLPVYESLGHVLQALEAEPHTASWHYLARHTAASAAVSIPAPSPAPEAAPAAAPALACDRATLLHLVELGDVDALVERSLLYGSEAQRAALSTNG